VDNIKENYIKEMKEEILLLEIERNFLLKDFSNKSEDIIFSTFSQIK
jgi:hypothetical protein